ncbi:MAG: hypothetical protein KAU60_17030 [Desulfobacterales bacterium]|jgi:hypothetical protein|nr:hypothetical protein [Desulfobacterales bacterium]
MLGQAYPLLILMYHDTKKVELSLEKGESQTEAIRDLEIHLKKFNKHCKETQHHLLEAAKIKRVTSPQAVEKGKLASFELYRAFER